MATKAINELYSRFVSAEQMGEVLVVVDDTDPGIDTTDHTDSPWMVKALNEMPMQEQFAEDGEVLTVPYSSLGPTLVIYWLCQEPKYTVQASGIFITMPFGRLAALYYGDDGLMKMNSYYAR